MIRPISAAAASRAKTKLLEALRSRSWFRGVGVVRTEDGTLALRVNVDPAASRGDLDIPDEVDGVPVTILRTRGYGPRDA